MSKLLIGVFALFLWASCSKDHVDPEMMAPLEIQKQLEAYYWEPVPVAGDEKNELYHYKPQDCEMDNLYSFSFSENAQKLIVDSGDEQCDKGEDTFEETIMQGAIDRSFTYDQEKSSMKFVNSDQYESYGVLIDGDYLVLTYRNNNQTANIIPMEYHFRGKSKTIAQ